MPQGIDTPGVKKLPWRDKTPEWPLREREFHGSTDRGGEWTKTPLPPEQPRRAEPAAAMTRKLRGGRVWWRHLAHGRAWQRKTTA